MPKIISLVFMVLFSSLVFAKTSSKKTVQQAVTFTHFPTFEEFRKMKENQKRDFIVAARTFAEKLAQNPGLRAQAKIDPSMLKLLLQFVAEDAQAQDSEAGEATARRYSEIYQALQRARNDQERAAIQKVIQERQALDAATERRNEAVERQRVLMQRMQDVPAGAENDNQRRLLQNQIDQTTNEVSNQTRQATFAETRVRNAQAEYDDVRRNLGAAEYRERNGLPAIDPRTGEAVTPAPQPAPAAPVPGSPATPPAGPKYTCIYAGFAIGDSSSCRPQNSMTLALRPGETPKTLSCTARSSGAAPAAPATPAPSGGLATPPPDAAAPAPSPATPPPSVAPPSQAGGVVGQEPFDSNKTVLCNPILFGTNNGRPICVSRRSDATRQCRIDAQALGDASIDAAIAAINANADRFNELRTMYERLCQGADASTIEGYLTQNQSTLLADRTPPARITDIASTCITFRERYTEVMSRRGTQPTTPAPGQPPGRLTSPGPAVRIPPMTIPPRTEEGRP